MSPSYCGLLGGLIHLGIRYTWKDSRRKQLRRRDEFFVLSLWLCPLSQRERARVRGFCKARGSSPQPSPGGRGSTNRPFSWPHYLHDWRSPPVDVDGDAREVAGLFRG